MRKSTSIITTATEEMRAMTARRGQPTVVFHSSLAPNDAVAALGRSIDRERRTIFSLSGYKGDAPIVGELSAVNFRLQKRRYWRNDFAPHFYGRFEPELGGTRIEGYFELSDWVRSFMRLWLGITVVIGGTIFLLTGLDLTAGTHFTTGSPWVGLAVLPVMLGFGLLLPKLGRLLSKADEYLILEHIERTLAARLEKPDTIV